MFGGQGSVVHRRVGVKYHPEPNRLLDHRESPQDLSLGSFVSLPSSLRNNQKYVWRKREVLLKHMG